MFEGGEDVGGGAAADVLVGRPRAHDLLDGIRSFERRTSVCVQRFLGVSLSVDRAQQVAWRTGPG